MAKKTLNSRLHRTAAYLSVGGLLLAILLVLFTAMNVNKYGVTFFNRAAISKLSAINIWGNAGVFNGTDSLVTARNSKSANPGFGFTAETWFKLNLVPNSGIDKNMTLINKIDYNDEAFLLNLHVTSQDGQKYTIGYYWVVNNANYNCQSDWTVSSIKNMDYENASKWQHIAGVIQQDGTLNLYINGHKEEGSFGNVSGTCMSNAPYRFGALAFGTRRGYFDGQMDEVRISNVARYDNSFTPSVSPFLPDSSTLILYHLDEKNGSTSLIDSSNNLRDGDISGQMLFVNSTIPSPVAGTGN